MNRLTVHDWEEHQTYRKDRQPPPWIKVHRRLFMSSKWAQLTDAEKGQLVSIWILAADKNGVVPGDANILRKLAQLDDAPNIKKFTQLGFLASTGCQSDAPEAEAEAEAEAENTTSTAARFDAWWALYPKKVEKKKAKAIWRRRKLDRIADTLIADTKQRPKADAKWQAGYIPNPTTYLNGDRWEDEYQQARTNGTELPKDDNACVKFLAQRGINPKPGESMWDFRRRGEVAIRGN